MEKEITMINEAIKILKDEEYASISKLQRKLRIGYARAYLLMGQLEERGIVGEDKGHKPREILNPPKK